MYKHQIHPENLNIVNFSSHEYKCRKYILIGIDTLSNARAAFYSNGNFSELNSIVKNIPIKERIISLKTESKKLIELFQSIQKETIKEINNHIVIDLSKILFSIDAKDDWLTIINFLDAINRLKSKEIILSLVFPPINNETNEEETLSFKKLNIENISMFESNKGPLLLDFSKSPLRYCNITAIQENQSVSFDDTENLRIITIDQNNGSITINNSSAQTLIIANHSPCTSKVLSKNSPELNISYKDKYIIFIPEYSRKVTVK